MAEQCDVAFGSHKETLYHGGLQLCSRRTPSL